MIFSQTCRNDAYLLQKNISYEVIDDQSGSSRPVVWSYVSTGTYGAVYNYTYDGNGNILSEKVDGKTTTYVYDSANQLIRENNEKAGKTWVWTYDEAGNILTKKEYAYTTGSLGNVMNVITYTYGDAQWGDLLTVYSGKSITYDTIGNPLNDGTWSYTWEQGRQLAAMTNGSTTWNYSYDSNGMRTSRTNGTTTYTYVYSDSQLSRMLFGSTTMVFAYDANGRPLAVTYNGTTYYYVLNLQGDVVAILDSTGAAVVNYTYDAWGKPLSTSGTMSATLGLHNPLRYRGYVYDSGTGLYYLQSRYYNPIWGRFINADTFISTGQGFAGNNMFAYCGNNPVSNYDPTGHLAISLTMLGLIVGAVVGAVAGGVVAHNVAKDSGAEGWELAGWTALGVLGGGAVGGALGAAGGALVTKLTGVIGLSITQYSIIPIREVTLLGNMPTYIEQAVGIGAGFYKISDTLYNSLSVAERLSNNMQYIKDAAALGSQFVLSPEWVTKQGSTLWYEIQCLIDNIIAWIMY